MSEQKNDKHSFPEISSAVRLACDRSLGAIDQNFLCQSLSFLDLKEPLVLSEDASVEEVLASLRSHRAGCVLLVDKAGKLTGIFSERDCVLKVTEDFATQIKRPIKELMTVDPITQPPDGTVAFALALMAEGGFRNIPIVDSESRPIGMVSAKDVVDRLVNGFLSDILNFPTA